MSEVYRAMKTLDFEWKVINPYHVQVKKNKRICKSDQLSLFSIFQVRRNPSNAKYVKMSLQLYQVDYKSYLLDFKSLVEEDGQAVEINSSMDKSALVEVQESTITGHHTMEFFEMCAALITQLAR